MALAKRIAKWSGGTVVLALLALQLIPLNHTNPPIEQEIAAAPEVRGILRRSCYDCHSNETRWPWYSRIAPVSWLVARDVRKGREELNFSTWNRLTPQRQAKALRESWETVAEREMPPFIYLPPHPEARLSDADRSILRAWSAAGGGGAEAGEEDEH